LKEISHRSNPSAAFAVLALLLNAAGWPSEGGVSTKSFAPGDRVRLTTEAIKNCLRRPTDIWTVTGFLRSDVPEVLWDGQRIATPFHQYWLELDVGDPPDEPVIRQRRTEPSAAARTRPPD
jgi:hypothetical protein